MKQKFDISTHFIPAGDQVKAIAALTKGVKVGQRAQTLLGVTGSGKTFTIAHVIQNVQRPTLVIAPNKTLAAQLAQEFRVFFPKSAVEYFVSYYDYYQPEAYVPSSATYIEKEVEINQEIDRLRHAATVAALTRRDTIIVASVSCIFGLCTPAYYREGMITLTRGMIFLRDALLQSLIALRYERTAAALTRGHFRAIGNTVEVMLSGREVVLRIEFSGEHIECIYEC